MKNALLGEVKKTMSAYFVLFVVQRARQFDKILSYLPLPLGEGTADRSRVWSCGEETGCGIGVGTHRPSQVTVRRRRHRYY